MFRQVKADLGMAAGKPIIGLTGGIGSGKSTVASMLESLGAAVISADRLSHEELDSPEVLERVRASWGAAMVLPDGRADRDEIRRIVAHDPSARGQLESWLHPRITRRRDELTRYFQQDPSVRAIVWDAPLLHEAGWAEQCTCIIFVDAAEDVRAARVLRERGWTADELAKLEKAQKPLDFKRASADHRVVNNSDTDALRRRVEGVFSQILPGA